MRSTYVMRDGELVPKSEARPLNASAYVISDNMDAALNHADGKVYDSKRAFIKAVHRAGCEIIGNESPHVKRDITPSITGHDIKRAIDQIRSR